MDKILPVYQTYRETGSPFTGRRVQLMLRKYLYSVLRSGEELAMESPFPEILLKHGSNEDLKKVSDHIETLVSLSASSLMLLEEINDELIRRRPIQVIYPRSEWKPENMHIPMHKKVDKDDQFTPEEKEEIRQQLVIKAPQIEDELRWLEETIIPCLDGHSTFRLDKPMTLVDDHSDGPCPNVHKIVYRMRLPMSASALAGLIRLRIRGEHVRPLLMLTEMGEQVGQDLQRAFVEWFCTKLDLPLLVYTELQNPDESETLLVKRLDEINERVWTYGLSPHVNVDHVHHILKDSICQLNVDDDNTDDIDYLNTHNIPFLRVTP